MPPVLVADDITHGDRGVNETHIISEWILFVCVALHSFPLAESLIWSYFNIVQKNIQDAIPKATMCFLVHVMRDCFFVLSFFTG